MEQVAKLKSTWNFTTVIQIVQKIPENYCPYLHLLIGQVCWLSELWFKIYIQNCTLSHVLILIMMSHTWYIMGRLKILKLEYLENGTSFFCEIKKFLTCASDETFEKFSFCIQQNKFSLIFRETGECLVARCTSCLD